MSHRLTMVFYTVFKNAPHMLLNYVYSINFSFIIQCFFFFLLDTDLQFK